MTKPFLGGVVLLENNGPVEIICGVITVVHKDDSRDLVNVWAFEDQNPTPWFLLKVPKKRELGEREPTPSWTWTWPPESWAWTWAAPPDWSAEKAALNLGQTDA